MSEISLVIVVGGDPLARRICEQLVATLGHRVHVPWPMDDATRETFESTGATVTALPPDDDQAVISADIRGAEAILIVAEDDGLNLRSDYARACSTPMCAWSCDNYGRGSPRRSNRIFPIAPSSHSPRIRLQVTPVRHSIRRVFSRYASRRMALS